jgi:CBS domain containing-hemolysin-like protein
MRKSSVQLAVIMSDGRMRGVVTLADILKRVLPVATAS